MSSVDRIKWAEMDLDHNGLSYRSATLTSLVDCGIPDDVILSAVKSYLKHGIDKVAERLRGKMTTPGAGQAMEYQETQAQAFAALANPDSASPAKYPMLAATIGIDIDPTSGQPASDVLGVARSVVAAYEAWLMAGAAIRRVRLQGKAAVDAAQSLEAACSAVDAMEWPAL